MGTVWGQEEQRIVARCSTSLVASAVFSPCPLRNFILDNALVFGVLSHLVEDGAVDTVANVSDNHNHHDQYEHRIWRRGCAGLGVHALASSVMADSTTA